MTYVSPWHPPHLLMVSKIIVVGIFGLTFLSYTDASELRQLRNSVKNLALAKTVLLKSTNRTASGEFTDTNQIQKIFAKRMQEIGYQTTTDDNEEYDVSVVLECQEVSTKAKQTIESTHLKKQHSFRQSPPCVLQYQLQGQTIPWQRINRIVYAEGINTLKRLKNWNQEQAAGSRTLAYLNRYDFPLLLSAEWEHIDRLIQIFHAPNTTRNRQRLIILLLGEIHAEQAFPFLVNTLKEPHLTVASARALGEFGEQARHPLIHLLQTSPRSDVQEASAYGLGQIGALTGNSHSTPLPLGFLTTPGIDITVQTEVVWALGKAPDFASFQPLADLEQRIWQNASKDPDLQKLREAVDWSIREVRQGGHTDDY